MTNEEIAAALKEVESRSKSNVKRLDRMEERQDNLDKLVSAVTGLERDMKHTQGDVQEIKGDIKSLMDVPRNRWEGIIKTAITTVVGALVGAVIALVLKQM